MKALLWLSVSAAALMVPTAAQAQDNTTDPTAASNEVQASDEIVVTAERRSTSLQKTGVAATVLTGEDLIKKSINGVEQLQFASPSLTVNTTGQGNAFNIRGIGKAEQGSALTVGVVTYRDGIATLPGYFQSEPYFDIQSVEVLRGPQGTFAGGNASGGAVFITEKNPDTQSVNGYALAEYGNYNALKLQGAVNLPVSDTLAVRFAGNMERRDTFYHVSGPWTGNAGDRRAYSGRASILWQPSSNFKLLLKGDYNDIEYGGLPASPNTATGDPLYVSSNAYLNGRDKFLRVSLNLSYTTDGGTVFRSISGYQNAVTEADIDSDATANVGTPTAVAATFHDHIPEIIWSQEFNIVSPDTGPFTWIVGGYWQHDKLTFPPGGVVTDVTPNTFVPLNIDTSTTGTNPRTALAGFGQIGYQITDGLQVTLGARYSRTTSRNDAISTTPQIPGLSLSQHDFTAAKKLNGKIAVNWNVDPNNFVYAFVATGSKAGGLNGPNLVGPPPHAFDPEDVTDFEAGWKGTFADGHLRTQLGGYYNIYEGLQVIIVDPRNIGLGSIYNVAGKTRMYGIEASAQGNFDAFSFDFSASVSNSKLGTFYAIDPRTPVPAGTPTCNTDTGPVTARCLDLTGNKTPFAPRFTLSGGVQYAIDLGGDTKLTPRIDYAHIGAAWGTVYENPLGGDRLEARDIFNAQLNLSLDKWTLGAFSTNFTNQHYVAATNGVRRLAGAPRQYGVRVSRSF